MVPMKYILCTPGSGKTWPTIYPHAPSPWPRWPPASSMSAGPCASNSETNVVHARRLLPAQTLCANAIKSGIETPAALWPTHLHSIVIPDWPPTDAGRPTAVYAEVLHRAVQIPAALDCTWRRW